MITSPDLRFSDSSVSNSQLWKSDRFSWKVGVQLFPKLTADEEKLKRLSSKFNHFPENSFNFSIGTTWLSCTFYWPIVHNLGKYVQNFELWFGKLLKICPSILPALIHAAHLTVWVGCWYIMQAIPCHALLAHQLPNSKISLMTFQVGAKCTKSQTAIKRCKLGEVTIPTASHCCFRRHITTKIGAFMKYFFPPLLSATQLFSVSQYFHISPIFGQNVVPALC